MGFEITPSTFFPAILFGPKTRDDLREHGGVEYISTPDTWYPVSLFPEKAHLFEWAPVRSNHPDFGVNAHDFGRVVGPITWSDPAKSLYGVLEIKVPLVARQLEVLLSKGERVAISPSWRVYCDGGVLVYDIADIVAVDFVTEAFSSAHVLPVTPNLRQRNLEELLKFGNCEQIAEAVGC
jgi:hypothetical protein